MRGGDAKVTLDQAIESAIELKFEKDLIVNKLLVLPDPENGLLHFSDFARDAMNAWLKCRGDREGAVWKGLTSEGVKAMIKARNDERPPTRGSKA
jgi:hypothetical protein